MAHASFVLPYVHCTIIPGVSSVLNFREVLWLIDKTFSLWLAEILDFYDFVIFHFELITFLLIPYSQLLVNEF